MSGTSARDLAFLAEMGIAPQWTLRVQPAAAPVMPQAAESAAPAQSPPPQQAAVDAPAGAHAAHEHADMVAPPQPDYIVAASQAFAGAYARVEPPVEEIVDTGPTQEERIARMDWDELNDAIANCTRCGLCKDGRKPVPGRGAREAVWLVAAGASSAIDEQEGAPLSGEPGRLLANMLAAAGHAAETDTYVTNLIKCRPANSKGGDRAPTLDEARACRPYLARELALSGATLLLTLGQIAANALQDKPLQSPLSGSRGERHSVDGVTMVATLHPGELLRRGADKALAWADLCLANSADDHAG